MANTEIRNLLQFVRKAEDEIDKALGKSGLTQPQRDLLDEAAASLRDLDNTLVLVDLNRHIERLEAKSKDLDALNRTVQKKLEGLRGVAQAIDKAAGALGALVKAFGILTKAGLA